MKTLFFILFPLVAFSQTIVLSDDDVTAFYGAEGFGKNTTGGRGSANIYQVTNLSGSSSVPGSLPWAVEQAEDNGGGVIVFRVGGTIIVTTPISVGYEDAGNITIAGQTAPGDGISIRMSTTATFGAPLEVRGSNVILRYLRTYAGLATHSGADNLRIHTSGSASEPTTPGYVLQNVIADHLSLYWSTDESIEIGSYADATIKNITIQKCIVAEAMESGYGAVVYRSSSYEGEPTGVDSVTFYGNLFSDIVDRYPRATNSGTYHESINNLWYNTATNYGVVWGSEADVINNVMKFGGSVQPSATNGTFNYYQKSAALPQPESWVVGADGQVWDENNQIINDNSGRALYGGTWLTYKTAGRIKSSGLTPRDTVGLDDWVLADVGASLVRDFHDTRIVDNYINGTGTHVTNENQVGGFLTYNDGTPYLDEDGDGLSDNYELAQGGTNIEVSPTARPATFSLVGGGTVDQSGVTNYATEGYTHMDVFLGELVGDWTGVATPDPPGPGSGKPTTSGTTAQTAQLIAH